jgi:GT2 family glycosyltransferase
MLQDKLNIVIGTYNRLPLLQQCLDALIGKIRTKHEIIVIDAGSTDGTREYLKGLQGIRLICDDELFGQAQSLNRVFKKLDSTYVCWLSDDNIVQDGILDLAVSILNQDSKIGMVSLKVKDISGPHTDKPYIGGIWSSGILNCNQGMIATHLLLSLGGFDEEFRDYGIDGDLTTKVLLAGYKVVVTKQIAIHHLRDHNTVSWTDEKSRKQRLDASRALYEKKYENLIHSKYGGQYNKDERHNSLLMRGVIALYHRTKRKGIPLGKWIDLDEIDWRNMIVGRFISPVDFLRNIHKPYYLVQKIPDALVKQVDNVNMRLDAKKN